MSMHTKEFCVICENALFAGYVPCWQSMSAEQKMEQSEPRYSTCYVISNLCCGMCQCHGFIASHSILYINCMDCFWLLADWLVFITVTIFIRTAVQFFPRSRVNCVEYFRLWLIAGCWLVQMWVAIRHCSSCVVYCSVKCFIVIFFPFFYVCVFFISSYGPSSLN